MRGDRVRAGGSGTVVAADMQAMPHHADGSCDDHARNLKPQQQQRDRGLAPVEPRLLACVEGAPDLRVVQQHKGGAPDADLCCAEPWRAGVDRQAGDQHRSTSQDRSHGPGPGRGRQTVGNHQIGQRVGCHEDDAVARPPCTAHQGPASKADARGVCQQDRLRPCAIGCEPEQVVCGSQHP